MLLDGLPEVFPPQGTNWSTEKFASTGETNAATGIQISEYETAVDSTCTTLANPRPAVSDIVETDEVSLWEASLNHIKYESIAEWYEHRRLEVKSSKQFTYIRFSL